MQHDASRLAFEGSDNIWSSGKLNCNESVRPAVRTEGKPSIRRRLAKVATAVRIHAARLPSAVALCWRDVQRPPEKRDGVTRRVGSQDR